jgi:HK97 family phage major capsid protein
VPLYTTAPANRGLLPNEFGPLVIQPFMQSSVAAMVSRTVTTNANKYRIPLVVSDPTAAFIAEGDTIPVSDPTLAELGVQPSKVAGLTIISREMADDSSPQAAAVVGEGLSRDVSKR